MCVMGQGHWTGGKLEEVPGSGEEGGVAADMANGAAGRVRTRFVIARRDSGTKVSLTLTLVVQFTSKVIRRKYILGALPKQIFRLYA